LGSGINRDCDSVRTELLKIWEWRWVATCYIWPLITNIWTGYKAIPDSYQRDGVCDQLRSSPGDGNWRGSQWWDSDNWYKWTYACMKVIVSECLSYMLYPSPITFTSTDAGSIR
jgi:hypothetical protein